MGNCLACLDANVYLHQLVGRGDAIELLRLLRAGKADVNIGDELSRTVLHKAAAQGNYDIVRLLIEFGALESARDHEGNLPIHFAAQHGAVAPLRLLVGGTGGLVNVENRAGRAPLHIAALYGNRDCALTLLDHGAHVDERDVDGNSAADLAGMYGHTSCALVLMERSADVAWQSAKVDTPLHKAIAARQTETAIALVNNLALSGAVSVDGPTDVRHSVFTATDSNSRTLLHAAALAGDPKLCQFVLDRWRSICSDIQEQLGGDGLRPPSRPGTVRSKVSFSGDPITPRSLRLSASDEPVDDDPQFMHELRKTNADAAFLLLLNTLDIRGRSALFDAVQSGSYDTVKLLLDAGIDFQKRDFQERSALDVSREQLSREGVNTVEEAAQIEGTAADLKQHLLRVVMKLEQQRIVERLFRAQYRDYTRDLTDKLRVASSVADGYTEKEAQLETRASHMHVRVQELESDLESVTKQLRVQRHRNIALRFQLATYRQAVGDLSRHKGVMRKSAIRAAAAAAASGEPL